jgi:hypothetical protein
MTAPGVIIAGGGWAVFILILIARAAGIGACLHHRPQAPAPGPGAATPPAARQPSPRLPPAPASPARENSPVPPAPGPPLPRRTPPACPDCGAPLSYSISVWDCDQIRIYGPSGRLTGATLCLDGEMRRLPL